MSIVEISSFIFLDTFPQFVFCNFYNIIKKNKKCFKEEFFIDPDELRMARSIPDYVSKIFRIQYKVRLVEKDAYRGGMDVTKVLYHYYIL